MWTILRLRFFNDTAFKKIYHIKENLILLKSINKKKVDLQTETFFVSRDQKCPFRQHTLQYIQDKSLLNSQVIEIDSFDIILAMVSAQKGIAFLPESSLGNGFETANDIEPKVFEINFYIRKDSNKSIPNFLIS
ncbi:hypothetical protein JOD43_003349 [Pullulanibacillus pueri]|uniref:LysR substrate-binding domain-containing protein n=1 Tax=Pullulanibacillus pueri TaxID=1437324 RepID=A0A8J2ZY82_9BACL|nr:LysR substrate-binding domain-containing protein [Pullulanibacillus pueri]MBM7683170.1 hypothetical protein [Pullulanibacillus pueri]GGH85681.1 hypothetical protein GCM10007096_31640 [Pullulanibacillus pueri]